MRHGKHTDVYIDSMIVRWSLQGLKLSPALGISCSIRQSTSIPWYIVHQKYILIRSIRRPLKVETIIDVVGAWLPHPWSQCRTRSSRCTRCCTHCSRKPPSWTGPCWTCSCCRNRTLSLSRTSRSALASPRLPDTGNVPDYKVVAIYPSRLTCKPIVI